MTVPPLPPGKGDEIRRGGYDAYSPGLGPTRCSCPDRFRWLNWLRGHRFPCLHSYRRP